MQLLEEGQKYHSKLEEAQTAGQQHNPEGEGEIACHKTETYFLFYWKRKKKNALDQIFLNNSSH